MATLIKIDGTRENIQPKNGRCFELEELQKYVGGLVEYVGISEEETMVINEEGKLIGLEINEDEYRKFGQWFSELVESFNQRYDRTTPLTPLTTDSYFSARLPNTDKCICLNFELIKRTYPELMRDVLGQDRC